MNLASTIALAAIGLSGLLCLLRIARGPTLGDRIMATDTLLLVIVSGLLVSAARSGSGLNVTLLVVIALVGFVGTSFLARFLELRGGDR